MMISPAELRNLLRYNPDSGELIWRVRPASLFASRKQTSAHNAARWNKRYAGKPAFTSCDDGGYRQGQIWGAGYRAHRVVWAIHYGFWPSEEIDHINHDRADNRIANLRLSTRMENCQNVSRSSRNTSGVTGVVWRADRQRWRASITVNRKVKYLGLFGNFHAAVAARKNAEREFGFHENHGAHQ